MTPELARLRAIVVNTKLFNEKYSPVRRDFVEESSKVDEYDDLKQKEKDIIDDCMKSEALTVEEWHQKYLEGNWTDLVD
jgi:hypothetical protein